MNTTTVYENNGIRATSYQFHDVTKIIFNPYDVIIIASSWDARCLNLTNSNIQNSPYGILFTFDDKDGYGFRKQHDEILEGWISSKAKIYKNIGGDSTDVRNAFSQLLRILTQISIEYERPLNILFDLSTCPRYISLSTLSKGFNLGILKKVDYHYGECLYPEPVGGILGGIEEVMFTSGEWETLPLEHCLGQFNPSNRTLFTVSIGFEGNKILRVLNVEDPDIVKILVPEPGYTSEYVQRVIEANTELIREYQLNNSDMLKAHAGDAIAAWQVLDESINCSPDGVNHSYLCTGSKPHSLGMTISAMANENIAVLYTLPKEHNFVKVEPITKYWLYQIDNLTVPTL